MSSKKRDVLGPRIAGIASAALAQRGYVSAIDIMLGIGWLSPAGLEDWRKGRVPFLERVVQANLSRISDAMKLLRSWASHAKLKPSPTGYMRHGKGPKHRLRFSKSGAPAIEAAYATHWVSPRLADEKRKRLAAKASEGHAAAADASVANASVADASAGEAPDAEVL